MHLLRLAMIVCALGLTPSAAATTTAPVANVASSTPSFAIAFGASGLPVVVHTIDEPTSPESALALVSCVTPDCTVSTGSGVIASGGIGPVGLVIPPDGRPIVTFVQRLPAGPSVKVLRCADPHCFAFGTVTLPRAPDPLPHVARFPATGIALGADGLPIVAFDQYASIRIVKCRNLACSDFGMVDAPLENTVATSVAVGPDGLPVIGTITQGTLAIGKCAAGDCSAAPSFTLLSDTYANSYSLRVGPDNRPIVATPVGYPATFQGASGLRVLRCVEPACDGGFSHNRISVSSGQAALAIGHDGLPRVALSDFDFSLVVAKCGVASCASDSTLTVADGERFVGVSSIAPSAMAIGGDGVPAIAYLDADTRTLLVAHCGNASCQDETAVRAIGQSGEPLAFLTSLEGGRVEVVDTVSEAVVAEIAVGSGPTGVAFSGDGRKAYVTNVSSGSVSYIDVASRTVERTVALGYLSQPRGIAVAPDHARLYVALGGTNEVALIDRAGGAVIASVPTGAQPFGLALAPDGDVGVVANTAGNSATFFSANVALGTVTVGQQPYGVSIAPDGSVAYVANFGSNSVSVLSIATRSVVGTIPVGVGPFSIAVNRDGSRLYVSDNQNNVSVVDTGSRTVIATIPVDWHPQGVALTPDDSRLYVANEGASTVSIVDTTTNAVVRTLQAEVQTPVSLGSFISPPLGAIRAVEYVHASFGHYFVTAIPAEVQALDGGSFAGWARTGETFDVYDTGSGHADVCRFFTIAFPPKSSHFYTPLVNECDIVKTNPDWIYEGIVFEVRLPTGAACPVGTTPLYRLYNNGQGGAPNHRYTTKTSIRDQMVAAGFVFEGATGCVPK